MVSAQTVSSYFELEATFIKHASFEDTLSSVLEYLH